VSVSELKKNPTRIMSGLVGRPVAILNHNRIMAYMLEPEVYEAMLERLDELGLIEIAKARASGKGVPVDLDALQS
jgi:antitoxin StbD